MGAAGLVVEKGRGRGEKSHQSMGDSSNGQRDGVFDVG